MLQGATCTMIAGVFKQILTLLVLIDPISVLPVFMAAVARLTLHEAKAYARNLGIFVGLTLLVIGIAGAQLLQMLGVSLAAMQIGGGAISLLIAVAMVLGHEVHARGTHSELEQAGCAPSLVPLGLPLLAGPAALSYMIATGAAHSAWGVFSAALACTAAGLATWGTFRLGLRLGKALRQSTLHLIERIAGFILAMLSIEMIGQGARAMFPGLAG
jgi:multiple antibiotic resistance protein